MLSCPYFVKKKSILSKTQCSHVIFFNFLWKIPYCHAHIWSKNVNSVKTTLYYGPTKSIGCPFFPIFHEKIPALMTIFCQKNVHSLKNKLLSCLYFVKKSILSKTLRSHVIFFQIFHEKPLLLCPYLVKKTSILSKLHYIMGQKSQ